LVDEASSRHQKKDLNDFLTLKFQLDFLGPIWPSGFSGEVIFINYPLKILTPVAARFRD
jgi:hypothetical protein